VLAGFLLGAVATVMQVILPPEARAFRDAFVYGAVILVLIFQKQIVSGLTQGAVKG
jgi:branched-chain amino acid transport system permease protein